MPPLSKGHRVVLCKSLDQESVEATANATRFEECTERTQFSDEIDKNEHDARNEVKGVVGGGKLMINMFRKFLRVLPLRTGMIWICNSAANVRKDGNAQFDRATRLQLQPFDALSTMLLVYCLQNTQMRTTG